MRNEGEFKVKSASIVVIRIIACLFSAISKGGSCAYCDLKGSEGGRDSRGTHA